jgi:hypothetical protein
LKAGLPRELNTPAFSFVIYDRDTDDEYGLQNLHIHVFVVWIVGKQHR